MRYLVAEPYFGMINAYGLQGDVALSLKACKFKR